MAYLPFQRRPCSYADGGGWSRRTKCCFDVTQYGGELDYAADGRYPLFTIRSREWDEALPVVLVTGGVHGYETSGVHDALRFVERHAAEFAGRTNLLWRRA
ncbi:MAG: hypothetical protein IPF45_03780 [Thermomonas sp.]|nr:hypothetical protein [Thermomonas sp.]